MLSSVETVGGCPPEDELVEFVRGGLASPVRARLTAHVGGCEACGAAVALALRIATGARPRQSWSGPPARVGPYDVGDEIGRGGMGVVYRGRDARLGREVALKRVSLAAGPACGPRLIREARLLARLKHPSIVQVYAVERVGSENYIVMELVRGGTLRTWQSTEPSRAQILDAYEAAGSGLAAAHRVGVVHRDFKPENVLVSVDGQVRVVDFGLAASLSSERAVDASTLVSGELTRDTTTGPGGLAGTPAYMAPEQFVGGSVRSALADQFQFCVALFEAVAGHRPFSGKTPRELYRSVLSGDIAARGVPRRLLRVLRRGLCPVPQDRFPSMDALLSALRRSRAPRSRAVLGGAALLGAAALAVALVPGSPTTDADAETRVLVAPLPSGATAALAVARQTYELQRFADARAAADLALRHAAATEDPSTAARALLLRGRAALDLDEVTAARLDLDQAYALASRGGADRIATAAATSSLSLELGAGVLDRAQWWGRAAAAALERLPALDADEERHELELAHGQLLAEQGDDAGALTAADRCLEGVEGATTEAGASLRGRCAQLRGETLERQGRAELGVRVLQGALQRAHADGTPCATAAGLRVALARSAVRAGDDARAAELAEHALRDLELIYGEEHSVVLPALAVLAGVAVRGRDPSRARRVATRAVAITEKTYGLANLKTADALEELASVVGTGGDLPQEIAIRHRVVAIRRELLGPTHHAVSVALNNLGMSMASSDPEAAIPLLREALAIRLGTGNDLSVAYVRHNLGCALGADGQIDAGLDELMQAAGTFEAVGGSEDSRLGWALRKIGAFELERGRPEAALPHLRRAEQIAVLLRGDNHSEVAKPRVLIASALARLGARPQARALLRQVLPSARLLVRARALFELAKLDWRRAPARAVSLAREAKTLISDQVADTRRVRWEPEVDRWLAARRASF